MPKTTTFLTILFFFVSAPIVSANPHTIKPSEISCLTDALYALGQKIDTVGLTLTNEAPTTDEIDRAENLYYSKDHNGTSIILTRISIVLWEGGKTFVSFKGVDNIAGVWKVLEYRRWFDPAECTH